MIQSTSSVRVSGARRLCAGMLLCTLGIAGCDSGPYQSGPVDPFKARQTLEIVMESWKNGASPDSLQSQTPKIVVQDFDWMAGMKLVDYQVLDEGDAVDANLMARVKLMLADGGGNQWERTVIYVVGTAPVLTVFRGFQ